MTNTQLQSIMQKSIEIQNKLFNRLEVERSNNDNKAMEWTACQIAYQKSIYKTAMQMRGGCYVVNGIACVTEYEIEDYFNQVVK